MRYDIFLTRFAMGVSTVALALGLFELGVRIGAAPDGFSLKKISLLVVFSLAILSLFYGNIVYQWTRIGQLRRHSGYKDGPDHARALKTDLAPSVTILIPAYKEQISVVMQTVVSAALSEYPNRSLTLLIDDPPNCRGADQLALRATRQLVVELDEFFRRAAQNFDAAGIAYDGRANSGPLDFIRERQILAGLYLEAADVIERIGKRYAELSQPGFAHADEVFKREIIDQLAHKHRERAAALLIDASLEEMSASREYRRLANLFAIPITSFERKKFGNLSHAPNKAMNLNSYLGLIGKSYRISKSFDGPALLIESETAEADLVLPEAEYILTVDADSIILPNYLLKLVSIMEADQRIAIAQTPYSAYPNPPSLLERVAGATTDIQYLVHQGFSAYNATFWVGANAVLRRAALEEIETTVAERGHLVPIFIQDKTLIEDTGSTIDLVARGWRLHNHPERLSFSATPSDFGALAIQRRRWANGGLIIFPDLWSFRRSHGVSYLEMFIRSHYLLSPALANIGLLLLLIIPFGTEFSNIWFPIAASPYYLLYGRDLKRSGYQWRDLLRVYALTLLLVPVNLAGVYRSVEQLVTGRKSPFARTPKIEGRTAAPSTHLLTLCALTSTAVISAVMNLWQDNLLFFWFSAINTAFFLYGIVCLIGWRESFADLGLAFATSLTDEHADLSPPLVEQSNV